MKIELTSDQLIDLIYDFYVEWVSKEKVDPDDVIEEKQFWTSGIGHYIANILIHAGYVTEAEDNGRVN